MASRGRMRRGTKAGSGVVRKLGSLRSQCGGRYLKAVAARKRGVFELCSFPNTSSTQRLRNRQIGTHKRRILSRANCHFPRFSPYRAE